MTGSGRCRRSDAALVGLRQRLVIELDRRRNAKASFVRRIGRALSRVLHAARRVSGSPQKGSPSRHGDGPGAADDAGLERARAAVVAAATAELTSFLDDGGRLDFRFAGRPKLSIVLVLFNQAALTLRCLRSIRAGSFGAVQVILVDNGSADATGSLLQRLDGATIIRSPANLHYLRGANLGATEAVGEFLLLLNNDTELASGSLQTALSHLEHSPEVGAVGGRLVHVDGRLQEAGGIVWRDGSCYSYGRGRHPETGSCMFQRDVDYVSGAFLMTRRALFERLGRFDEALAPAYYEETDFCLRLWQAGHRVVFDPRILVHHFEFASGAPESAKALMRRNQAILVARHRAALRARHMPPLPEYPLPARSRDWDHVTGRVLLVTQAVPTGRGSSAESRSLFLARALQAAGWFVTVYPLADTGAGWEEVRAAWPITVEVMLDERQAGLRRFLRDRTGYYDRVVLVGAATVAALWRDPACTTVLAGDDRVYDLGAGEDNVDFAAEANFPADAALVLVSSEARAEELRRRGASRVAVLDTPRHLEHAAPDGTWSHLGAELDRLMQATGP